MTDIPRDRPKPSAADEARTLVKPIADDAATLSWTERMIASRDAFMKRQRQRRSGIVVLQDRSRRTV